MLNQLTNPLAQFYQVTGSLTTTNAYRLSGVSFLSTEWTVTAYEVLLGDGSRIYQALRITRYITVLGALLSLTITVALADGLSKLLRGMYAQFY